MCPKFSFLFPIKVFKPSFPRDLMLSGPAMPITNVENNKGARIIFIILTVPVLITVAVIGIYPDVGAALIPAGKTGHVDIDLFIMREG